MSWDGYTDNLIKQGFQKAAIIGVDGTLWCQSKNMTLTPEESKFIADGLNDNAKLCVNGVHAEGVKYMFLQADNTQIQCKKGKEGIAIAKANKCIVCGVYGESMPPGVARDKVEKMKSYLADNQY